MVMPLALCVEGIDNGWMPLSDAWKVRITDATSLADGRTFSEAVRDALPIGRASPASLPSR